MRYSSFITIARPSHWIKNGFILLPLLFSGHLSDIDALLSVLLAAFFFSILTSAVYTINDIADRKFDARHPQKKKSRPIASGEISVKEAWIFAFFLFIISFAGGIFFISSYTVLLLMSLYFVLNIGYSFYLKNASIIDVFIVASGFIIRILIGSAAAVVIPSAWIIIMTFLLALFLGFAKRRDDFRLDVGPEQVRGASGYNLQFIDSMIYILCGIIIIAYIQYTISDETQLNINSPYFYITSVFLIYGIFRYLQLVFVKGESGNPTKMLYKDRHLWITVLLWVISVIFFIY